MSRAVGVDLGTEALRGVVVERGAKGKLELVTAGSLPLGELGIMEDSEDKRLAISEKLKELVRGARLSAPLRRIAVPDRDAEIRYLMVPPVPPWRLEMLAKYEIEERSEDKEAKTFDFRILDISDPSGQYTVLLACCKEAAAEWILETGRKARLGEVEIDVRPLALYNAYYHGHGFEPDKTVLVVDIGAEHVTILLVRNGSLYHARTLLGGGRRFSHALADDMRMTPLEADEVKKNEGEIRFDLAPSGGRGTRVMRGRTAVMRRPPGGSSVQPGVAGEAASPQPGASGSALPGIQRPGLGTLRLRRDQAEPEAGEAPPANGAGEPPTEEIVPAARQKPGGTTLLTDDLRALGEGEPDPASTRAIQGVAAQVLGAGSGIQLGVGEEDLAAESPADQRKRKISMALVREAASLSAAMENVTAYCRQQNKLRDLKIDKVYLTGGGSLLKGLDVFLSRRMQAPVEPLDVFKNVSLERLPKEAAEGLKAERQYLAVAMGAALSGLCKGAFSFLLWPQALKEQKEFRGRSAFLYYAAAVVLVALGLLWWTPVRDGRVLAENYSRADAAIAQGLKESAKLKSQIEKCEEMQKRLEQIEKNAASGSFFLRILSHLKDKKKNPSFVWFTQISTTEPQVVSMGEGGEEGVPLAESSQLERRAERSKALQPDAPDIFTAQQKVYLRGFVRSPDKNLLFSKIYSKYDSRRQGDNLDLGICDLLVPHPENPDHPDNTFKDISVIWVESRVEDHREAETGWFLKEFVLVAYVEGTRESGKPKGEGAKKEPVPAGTPAGSDAAAPGTAARPRPAAPSASPERQPLEQPAGKGGSPAAPTGPQAPPPYLPAKPSAPREEERKEGDFVLPGGLEDGKK